MPIYFADSIRRPILGMQLIYAQIDIDGPADDDWSLQIHPASLVPLHLGPPPLKP